MKQQIDNLIANTLLNEGEIYLPGKGSLILRRHAAVRLSSKRLQTPYRELTFTPEERGVNLIALISKIANVPEERASDIFTEWLSKSSRVQSPTRRSLIIGGVCTIVTYGVDYESKKDNYRAEKSTVTTDQTFENMANPKGRKTKKINPRPRYFIYILVGALVGMALGVYGTYLYTQGTFDELLSKQTVIPTSESLKSKSSEIIAATEPTTESVAVDNTQVATETEVATENAVEATTEVPVETPTEQTTSAEPNATTEQPAEPKVEEQKVAETTEQPAQEAVEQGSEKSTELELLPLKKGHSYVVWGVYRDIKNAKKAIAWLGEKHPTIECKLYKYGNQHLLSVYDQPSRTKCNDQLAQWKKKHPSFRSVWVHTQY